MKHKLITIVGPTASGKSDLGVFLARKIGGEIISADSRQVYKGMDLGSGKITKKEMQRVPHYLLDVASPKNAKFNANKFKKQADAQIAKIIARGRVPIVVGGTGFWINALAFNQNFPEVKPDQKLRARLNKLSAERLFAMLKKVAPQRAQNIDPKNKRRLVRALEIAKHSKDFPTPAGPQKYQTLFIGLDMPDKILRQKIEKRYDARIKKGMLAEVQRLHKQGVSWSTLENFGLEYRFIAQYLQNKISKEQMRKLLLFAVWHYAKRQRTWFKRNKEIIWLDPNKKATAAKAVAVSKKFLAKTQG